MTEDQLKKIKESVEEFISAVCKASDTLSEALDPVLEETYERWEKLKVDGVLPYEHDDEVYGVEKLQNFMDSVTDFGPLYEAVHDIYSSLGIE